MDVATSSSQVVGALYGLHLSDSKVASEVTTYPGLSELVMMAEGYWFILGLGVDGQWQGKGVDDALLSHASTKATACHARGLATMIAHLPGDRSEFFLNAGFVEEAERNGLYSLGYPVTWVLATLHRLN